MYHPFGLALAALITAGQAAPAPYVAPVPPAERRLVLAIDQILATTARSDTPPPRREEPRREEPRREEPRRDEPRRDEPRRQPDRPRRDDPKPKVSPAPRSLGEPQLRRRRPE